MAGGTPIASIPKTQANNPFFMPFSNQNALGQPSWGIDYVADLMES